MKTTIYTPSLFHPSFFVTSNQTHIMWVFYRYDYVQGLGIDYVSLLLWRITCHSQMSNIEWVEVMFSVHQWIITSCVHSNCRLYLQLAFCRTRRSRDISSWNDLGSLSYFFTDYYGLQLWHCFSDSFSPISSIPNIPTFTYRW